MVFQRDKAPPPDYFDTGLPAAQLGGEEVPRWLVILGLVTGLTLLVAMLRYAIDLLGVVFVIILVGFAIRALGDWLTEGESVSGWAMSALSLGLMGTVLVALWLFNSRDLASQTLQDRLPGPIQRTVSWLEAQGWGQRVLLPGSSGSGAFAGGTGPADPRSRGGGDPAADASAPGEPVTSPAPARSSGLSGAIAAVTRPRPKTGRRGPAPGEAEAAPAGAQKGTTDPASAVEAPLVRTSVTLTSSPSRAVVGRSVRLTAYVHALGAESAPTGTVVFLSDDMELGRAPVRSGVAVLVTLDLGIGNHTLSASYDGDDAHLASRSPSISQPVARK